MLRSGHVALGKRTRKTEMISFLHSVIPNLDFILFGFNFVLPEGGGA